MNGEFTKDGVSDLAANSVGLSWSFWAISVGDDCAPGHPGGDCIKKNFGGILQPDWYSPACVFFCTSLSIATSIGIR